MKKIILSTTALFALSGVNAAIAADVQLSGNVKIDFETWADGQPDGPGENNNSMGSDMELWVKSEHFTDQGLRVRPEMRIKPGTASDSTPDTTPFIVISNQNGTIAVGEENSVAYSFSLGSDWRDTISGVNRVGLPDLEIAPIHRVSNISVSSRGQPKVAYMTPDWQGVKFGVSTTDPEGAGSRANIVSYGASFEAPRIFGVDVALAYGSSTRQNKVDNAAYKNEVNSEYGLQVKYGLWKGSYVKLDWEGGDRTSAADRAALTPDQNPGFNEQLTGNQSGEEFEVVYDLRPHLRVNAIWFKNKATTGTYANDTFESKGFGFKYDVYRGLEASFAFNAYDYQDFLTPNSLITNESRNDKQGYGYRLRLKADF